MVRHSAPEEGRNLARASRWVHDAVQMQWPERATTGTALCKPNTGGSPFQVEQTPPLPRQPSTLVQRQILYTFKISRK